MAKKYQHHKLPSCLGYPKHEGKDEENLTHFFGHYLDYSFENFVHMYSVVFADTQWCAVNEAYARAFAQKDLLDKQG